MADIKELPTPTKTGRFERIGAHTHIRGLGLDENLIALKVKDGIVGQEKAREAADLIVRMIKECKLSGKAIILVGSSYRKTDTSSAKSSLRYAVQLPSLAAQNAQALEHEKVKVEDVQRVDSLFMDIGEAAEHLKKYEEKLMKH